jgi:hypothetical protein
MWFNGLRQWLDEWTYRTVFPRSAHRFGGRESFRPILENLENRTLPSTYNAVNDFSLASNPNVPWSYGSLSNFTGGTFTLNTMAKRDQLFPGEIGWWNGQFPPNGVQLAKNTTGSTVHYETIVQPPDLLEVDGESKIADVRWVAPATGVYDITGRFQRIDNCGCEPVEVAIVKNGATMLFDAHGFTVFNAQLPFLPSLPRIALSAGDVLDFAEGPDHGGSSSFDSTGLAVNISTQESFNCFEALHINVDTFSLVFQGDLIHPDVLPDQSPYLHDSLTNAFATPGHTPLSITATLIPDPRDPGQMDTQVTFLGDSATPLIPGLGDEPGGTYPFGLHDTFSGPPALRLVSGQAMNSRTHQVQAVPVPTVVTNPLPGGQFKWVTFFLNYGPSADDQTNGVFWNAPVPVDEAANLSILNFSDAAYWKSTIRMGDPTDQPPDLDTLRGQDLIDSLHPLYDGPPLDEDPGNGTHFGISVDATTTAGTGVSVTVSTLDGGNNPIPSYTGTVHFSSSDGQAMLRDDYTFTAADQGVHTLTLTLATAGDQSLTVTDTATPAVSGMAIATVTAAAANHFQVDAPAHVRSRSPFAVTVTALDPYGNTDSNYQGMVTFSTTDPDPGVVLPADYTFTADDAGVHTFTNTGLGETILITHGRQTVTATDTADGTITGSVWVKVKPPAPAMIDEGWSLASLDAGDFGFLLSGSKHRSPGTMAAWSLELFGSDLLT